MSCFLKLATLFYACCSRPCGRSNRVGPEPLEEADTQNGRHHTERGGHRTERENNTADKKGHRNKQTDKQRPSSSKSDNWNTPNCQRPSTSKSSSHPGLSKPVFPALDTGWTTPLRFVAEKIEQVGEQAPLRETKEFVCQEVELERSLLDHEIIHVLSADCSRRHNNIMAETKDISRKRKIQKTKCRTQMPAATSTTRQNRPKAAVKRRICPSNDRTNTSTNGVKVVGLGCQSSGGLPEVSE